VDNGTESGSMLWVPTKLAKDAKTAVKARVEYIFVKFGCLEETIDLAGAVEVNDGSAPRRIAIEGSGTKL